MDRFKAMQVFVQVADQGSFTRAADSLNLPRATVTHTIQQLEARLGVRLLHRTTRQVRLTPDGEAYRERCQRLLAELEEAESAFGGKTSPKGKLRIDMHGKLGSEIVLPTLPAFLERYPDLEVQISTGDRYVDLVREGVDCVLRVGELKDSSMVARRVAELEVVTCASGAYLQKHGVPRTLEQLRGHMAVNYYSTATGRSEPLEFVVDGALKLVPLKSRVQVSTADAYLACCLAGLGFIQAPRYHMAEYLEDGRLREVLPRWRPESMPVSVMYPHSRQLSLRVRVFVDWVVEVFKARAADRARPQGVVVR